jgi:4-hydroxy-2-oxoheptanedioate aldolase
VADLRQVSAGNDALVVRTIRSAEVQRLQQQEKHSMKHQSGALRALWDRGEPTIGPWCAMPCVAAVETLGVAGFDWLIVDTQHGLIGNEDLRTLLPAASNAGVPVIVRPSWNEPSLIMRALDAGAEGVVVPMIDSPDDARQAIAACRFPPAGIRSWGPTRHIMHAPGYTPDEADRNTICVVMVETVEAVERIEEILGVPGIDGVFVGPNDLAVSAGFAPTGRPTEVEHLRLIETVVTACHRRGVVAGIACADATWVGRWRDAGFQMLAVSSDLDLLRSAAQRLLDEIGVARGDGETPDTHRSDVSESIEPRRG